MLNLLAAENIKLLRSKKLWIVLAVCFLLPVLQAVEARYDYNGEVLVQKLETVVNGASGVLMMEKNGVTVLLVISAFISFFIGEEFQNGTIRNALSLGRGRTQYYLSKFVVASIISFIGVLLLTASGMIGYSFAFGFGDIAEISHYASYAFQAFITLFLLIWASVSIFVMVGFLTQNSGISLIWNFLITIGTGFGAPIFLQTEHFKQVTFWFTQSFLFYSDFASPADIARFSEMIVVSLITILVSSIVGILLFTRTDIK
ncbi:ABC transporter permease [Paenibacillus sp. strain BS8-2]